MGTLFILLAKTEESHNANNIFYFYFCLIPVRHLSEVCVRFCKKHWSNFKKKCPSVSRYVRSVCLTMQNYRATMLIIFWKAIVELSILVPFKNLSLTTYLLFWRSSTYLSVTHTFLPKWKYYYLKSGLTNLNEIW